MTQRHPADRAALRKKYKGANRNPPSLQSRTNLSVRVVPDLLDLIERTAASEGVSKNQWIDKVLRQKLQSPPQVPIEERPRGYRISDEPKIKKVGLNYTADSDFRNRIDERAKLELVFRSEWIVEAIEESLDARKPSHEPFPDAD